MVWGFFVARRPMSTRMTISRRYPVDRKHLKDSITIGENCTIVCFQELCTLAMDDDISDLAFDLFRWDGEAAVSSTADAHFIKELYKCLNENYDPEYTDTDEEAEILKKEIAILDSIKGECLYQIDIG